MSLQAPLKSLCDWNSKGSDQGSYPKGPVATFCLPQEPATGVVLGHPLLLAPLLHQIRRKIRTTKSEALRTKGRSSNGKPFRLNCCNLTATNFVESGHPRSRLGHNVQSASMIAFGGASNPNPPHGFQRDAQPEVSDVGRIVPANI